MTNSDRHNRAYERMNASGTDDRALNLALEWVDLTDRLNAARDRLIHQVVKAELDYEHTHDIGRRDAAARAHTLFGAFVDFMATGGAIADHRAAREAARLIIDHAKAARAATEIDDTDPDWPLAA